MCSAVCFSDIRTPCWPERIVGTAAEFALVEQMVEIRVARPRHGCRRIQAQPRREGSVANNKKIRRMLREKSWRVVCKHRFVRATDGYHDLTVPPNLAAAMTPTGPIYLAVILDAWSRRVAGYALAPHMDVRGSHWRRWPARDRVTPAAGRMRPPHRPWQLDPTLG
jgi:HTH-like domain